MENRFKPPVIEDWNFDDERQPTTEEVQGKRSYDSVPQGHNWKTNAILLLKYNLFSVSQICDKRNNVLFTNIGCLVLSSDFKLLDESQFLLRVPRKDNIYSVDLKSVIPTKGTGRSEKRLVVKTGESNEQIGRGTMSIERRKVIGEEGRDREYKGDRVGEVECGEGREALEAHGGPYRQFVGRTYYPLPYTVLLSLFPDSLLPPTLFSVPSYLYNLLSLLLLTTTPSLHLDHLGKFDGKADEGFFVGYSVVSKAMREFNKRTMDSEKTLNIIVAGNQTNGIVGTRDNIVTSQAEKKIEPEQEYILIPIYTTDPLISQDPRVATRREFERLLQLRKDTENLTVNAAEASNAFKEHLFERFSPFKNTFTLPPVSNVTLMDDARIFGNAYDDEDVGAEADLNKLETTLNVSPIPTTKIGKDHPKVQIIGDFKSAIQTRRMTKIFDEHVMVYYINKQMRTNYKDYQNYLFAYFLSQMEPKKVIQALEDPSWIEAMQEELLQFQLQKVWTLVNLPDGKRAIDEAIQVYKVEKALYGLHQAPRAWFTKKSLCDEFEGLMHKRFQMSSMGKLTFFLGLQTASTPMEPNKALVKDEEADSVDVHLYRSMIGSLMYLIASRPNIMFAVCACARFQVTPKMSHIHVVNMIFRYLKGQPKLGLWYPRDSPFDLEAFCQPK
ncbi:hypothetical protein Tco_0978287 [Tanacetum coccineum]|uniref:Reverse transcriptase Ty1/copia-type domain-containing protein n=1 Tax=Tanacetum coccineum TaxID=301880 RepID=A0ABQ5EMM9_9ASTR